MNRVDRDEAETKVLVKVLVGRNVATATLQPHLHVDLATLGDRANINIRVENLNVAVGFDHARSDHAGNIGAQVERLRPVAIQLERNLLQVQNDVGRILDNARDRLELMQYAFDSHGRNRRAFNRRKQRAPQSIADRRAKPALKRLRAEFTEFLVKCFVLDGKTLGLLETSPKHR